MRILIANDHGAIDLKRVISADLTQAGHQVDNLGVDATDSVDYPDIARQAGERFLQGGYDFGILCCGSGIGISIAANKVKGIRCAQVFDLYSAEMCKRHNNANFIAFGGRVNYAMPVTAMIRAYMAAEFEGERHQRRVDKLDSMQP
ncbi:MAG: ribose-5-phosphate isomerase [Spirochaetes bacterium GWD1_61_31]|nr:MAG: ribose-5-phosphate isomerase [Spirochaetes bacterium GWB1_60_80]OHD35477.1 MAG: ribose-5-phosphate isomerase [Spirochaetes bacterium GWC1_61_12]OHD42505.1 MAG: ribose-5-phosphate isomerase [Spirochaetes bacterium GWE1_60_18]OHD43172.1 MAG: ribose-5-phosphate isomerase [Spirochaetes bacterium GWD1_61_31]OHD58233.1 MAG: ribose-5-phosphate isomerase [Spirochaetes bacterium GWF1_60_12]HAP42488.1 ribose-5-phosphate isomerase [Spirochaetaceae bacterium]